MSKKRYKKGIQSLKKQVQLHQEKKEMAMQERNTELAAYFDKELERMHGQILEKQKKLKKKG